MSSALCWLWMLLQAYLYRFRRLCHILCHNWIKFSIIIIWNVVIAVFLAASWNFWLYFFILPRSQKASEWSSDDESRELQAVAPVPMQTNHVQTEGLAPCHSYRKSLRLSSDQIVRWLVNYIGCFSDMCGVRETLKNVFKQTTKHKSWRCWCHVLTVLNMR